MKMKCAILLVLAVGLMSGCLYAPLVPIIEEGVNLVSSKGIIHAPMLNGRPFGYNANVQPGELIRIDFNPNRDQYGNRTGLNDSRYTIEAVTAKCELKTDPDTIFFDYSMNGSVDNVRIWFPGWTAPIENISGLPIPYLPLTGYPWDSCRSSNIPQMSSQQATITATARAAWIEVEFVLPERTGTYTLDLPGQSPFNASDDDADDVVVCVIRIAEPGVYEVIHSGGQIYEHTIPVDWFYIKGSWQIDVGPEGVC